METDAFRLHPDEDLRLALEARVGSRALPAAFVAGAVGSLATAVLRFADARGPTRIEGPLEIVSLTGTLGPDGAHLHAALADAQGRLVGGHVMPGCRVHTTAEIVLGVMRERVFARTHDPQTGYRELCVRAAPGTGSSRASGEGTDGSS